MCTTYSRRYSIFGRRAVATFDQREQTVTYQYNADQINFGNVSNRTEFAHQLENMRAEVARASNAKALDQSDAQEVQDALENVSVEIQKANPDKSRIASMLETAGSVVKGAAALGGLYMAIMKAIEVAHQIL